MSSSMISAGTPFSQIFHIALASVDLSASQSNQREQVNIAAQLMLKG